MITLVKSARTKYVADLETKKMEEKQKREQLEIKTEEANRAEKRKLLK